MKIEITDNSDIISNEFHDACLRALEKCGLVAEEYAKNLCPTAEEYGGTLKGSITHKVQPEEEAVYVGSPVKYAPYVEFGTGKYYPGGRQTPWAYKDDKGNWHMTNGQRAQPYLKPAVADHAEKYKEIIERELKGG